MKRTVVITGGTKGLGREVTLAFSRAGHFVVALYSSDVVAAAELTLELTKLKSKSCVWQHDITSDNLAIWERTEIKNAENLVLIHNACAPFVPVPMHHLNWEIFEQNLKVAIKGGWLCSQGIIRPMLKKRHGVIVNILSSVIEGASPKGFAAYATAKHALRGLTLALASEYGPRGVRVLSASPGFMDTPLTEKWNVRLRDTIRAASSRVTDTSIAANKLVELVQNETLAGQGEDYAI